jgi:hypothetical protein
MDEFDGTSTDIEDTPSITGDGGHFHGCKFDTISGDDVSLVVRGEVFFGGEETCMHDFLELVS